MHHQRITLIVACCVVTLLVVTCPGNSAASIDGGSANRTLFHPFARVKRADTFGDQCPKDFVNDYQKNEDICRRCAEHYGDSRFGNLCRQNCFTSCYYVRCKNLLECQVPYPTD